MANILSQDEVDSLLDGIGEGKVETEAAVVEESDGAALYDFSRTAGPVHLRLPALGMINERFVGMLRTNLPITSRAVIDVNLDSMESIKFGDFSRTIPLPSSLNLFKMEPLRGYSLLVLEGPLVFSFVDSSFGGRGDSSVKLEGRGFTAIETKIVQKMVKLILDYFQQAWADVYKIKATFQRSEMDPQFAAIVTPEDTVVAIKIAVHLENGSGTITICIPYSTIEPLRSKLKRRFQGEKSDIDLRWQKYFEKSIRDVAVKVSCTMGKAQINSQDLMAMKVNDVIMLDKKASDPIVVSVEGIPKFKAHAGAYNNKQAARISERYA